MRFGAFSLTFVVAQMQTALKPEFRRIEPHEVMRVRNASKNELFSLTFIVGMPLGAGAAR